MDEVCGRQIERAEPEPDEGYRVQRHLESQRRLLEGWLQSDEAIHYATRLVRRHQLQRSGEELVSEAWLRLNGTFERRSTPYPDLSSAESARRFLARVLDNLCRDMTRRASKHDHLELVESLEISSQPDGSSDGRVLLEQLVFAVGRRARAGVQCPGCRTQVVSSAALELIHLLLAGHDGSTSGSTMLDRLLYEALDRVEGSDELSDEARRQRKGRCGRCITSLLESGLRDLGVAV